MIEAYRKNNHPEMRPSSALRGGFVMMSKSGGLKPKAVAGRPSVTFKIKVYYVVYKRVNKKPTKLTHNN